MDDFDWVSESAKCSLSVIFQRLKNEVQSDVMKREEQLKSSTAHYGFKFDAGNEYFAVIVQGNKLRGSVDFRLGTNAISVAGSGFEDAPKFEVSLTLNDEGECKARIGREEKEFWQVRQMALEKFFFHTY